MISLCNSFIYYTKIFSILYNIMNRLSSVTSVILHSKKVTPPTAITNLSSTSFTGSSCVLTWSGGVGVGAGIQVSYTYTVLNYVSTSITYNVSGTGSGTTLSGLTDPPWIVTVTITNLGGSVSATTTTGPLALQFSFENNITNNNAYDDSGKFALPANSITAYNVFAKYGSKSLYCAGNSTSYLGLGNSAGATSWNGSLFINGQGLTFGCWVYPLNINDWNGFVCLTGNKAGRYAVIGTLSGGIYAGIQDRDSTVAPMTANSWYHLVWTITPDTITNPQSIFYINNVAYSTAPSPGGPGGWIDPTISWALSIGANIVYTYPSYFGNAYIDNVVLYNRFLSASEVSTLYNGGVVVY
jgi:hypothetical protein